MINFNYKPYYDKSTTQADKIVLDNIEYPIQAVHFIDDTYLDGNIFGTAIARQLEFELDTSVDIEGKEFVYYTGIKVNNNIEWINLGNFICYEVEPNDTTTINTIHSMDYMLKTNIPYESILNYSGENITLLQVLQELCTNCGITLATTNFANNSFIVDSNQFNEGELCRQVIQAIAQISGCVAKIKADNRLYLINPNNVNTVSKVLNLNNYSEVDIKRNTQPINSVILQLKDVEGENVTMRDETSIAQYGENKLVINNNPFAYSQEKRELLITALFNAVNGFEYKAFEMECQGLPYLETMDKVQIKDKEGNTFNSYLFRFEITSPDGLKSTMQAPSIIKSEVDYENIAGAYDIARLTEVKVDKATQTITALAQEVSQYNNRISQLEIDVNSIETLVRDEIDITRETEGIDTITLVNAMNGYLLELHIYGNNSVFEQLYPRNDLYPSDSLYPYGDSRIHIYTNNKCPDKITDWWNGYFNSSGIEYHNDPWNDAELICDYIPITQLECYVSLENTDYKLWSTIPYDENKIRITSGVTIVAINRQEKKATFPAGTKYIRLGIVKADYHYNETGYENNYPDIIPAEIIDIKPMVTYSTEKEEYCGYNNKTIELGVTDVLRRLVVGDIVIRDSFDLINNKASITRRIGVDGEGNLYNLGTPVTTDLGELQIMLATGTNYINIVNYNAECYAKWVINNNFTNTFASTVELESSITQLANSINLQVSKKVNNNEIIARINMAILNRDEAEVPEDIEQSIIEILANKIQITSDYFDLAQNGYITATGGTVGGITLSSNRLYKQYTQSNSNYESGLNLPNTISSGGNDVFLYSGRPVGENLVLSNMFVQHNGNIYFRSGSLNMIYEPTINQNGTSSWYNAMNFTADALNRYLPNGNRWTTEGIGYQSSVPNMHTLWLYDAKAYSIESGIHGTTLARFYRVGNNAEPAEIDFYADAYINGHQIQVATSDEREKENIEESDINALDIIKDIDFYKFDWKESKQHIDIGFVAQRLEKIYEKLVIHSVTRDNDTYSIDLLNTLALTTKGVQELNNKLEKQQKEIDELKEEIRKLKGEN